MIFFLPIETKRLILRPLTLNDLNDSIEHRADSDVCRYISVPMNASEVLSFINKSSINWQGNDHEKLAIGIQHKREKKIIGELMFKYIDQKNKIAEIGFRLNRHYHSKGFAKEATINLINVLFNKLGMNKITAICDVDNLSSYKLMEALGMTREAHFKSQVYLNGEWRDQYQYYI